MYRWSYNISNADVTPFMFLVPQIDFRLGNEQQSESDNQTFPNNLLVSVHTTEKQSPSVISFLNTSSVGNSSSPTPSPDDPHAWSLMYVSFKCGSDEKSTITVRPSGSLDVKGKMEDSDRRLSCLNIISGG